MKPHEQITKKPDSAEWWREIAQTLGAELHIERLRAEYWRKAAYGLHGESCNKPQCMADLEAKQP